MGLVRSTPAICLYSYFAGVDLSHYRGHVKHKTGAPELVNIITAKISISSIDPPQSMSCINEPINKLTAIVDHGYTSSTTLSWALCWYEMLFFLPLSPKYPVQVMQGGRHRFRSHSVLERRAKGMDWQSMFPCQMQETR